MGKLTYYLAISMDGYLARENGDIDWLQPFQGAVEGPYDYPQFYESVDALVMGRKTFEVLQSFGDYPYAGKQGYVFTRQERFDTDLPDVHVVREELPYAVRKIREAYRGRVWVVGGGQLAAEIAQAGLLDEIIVTIVPVTLGWGIPWLSGHLIQTDWVLVESHLCKESVIQLVYRRKYPVQGDEKAPPPAEPAKA